MPVCECKGEGQISQVVKAIIGAHSVPKRPNRYVEKALFN